MHHQRANVQRKQNREACLRKDWKTFQWIQLCNLQEPYSDAKDGTNLICDKERKELSNEELLFLPLQERIFTVVWLTIRPSSLCNEINIDKYITVIIAAKISSPPVSLTGPKRAQLLAIYLTNSTFSPTSTFHVWMCAS